MDHPVLANLLAQQHQAAQQPSATNLAGPALQALLQSSSALPVALGAPPFSADQQNAASVDLLSQLLLSGRTGQFGVGAPAALLLSGAAQPAALFQPPAPAASAPAHAASPASHGGGRAKGEARNSSQNYATRHQQAEARRRSRINERLEALRSIVPHSERANTATFLEEVVTHVQHLQRRVAELEAKLGLRPSLALPQQQSFSFGTVAGSAGAADTAPTVQMWGGGAAAAAAADSVGMPHQQPLPAAQPEPDGLAAAAALGVQQPQRQAWQPQRPLRAPGTHQPAKPASPGLPSAEEVLAMAVHLLPNAPPAMPGVLVGDRLISPAGLAAALMGAGHAPESAPPAPPPQRQAAPPPARQEPPRSSSLLAIAEAAMAQEQQEWGPEDGGQQQPPAADGAVREQRPGRSGGGSASGRDGSEQENGQLGDSDETEMEASGSEEAAAKRRRVEAGEQA
eukprot:scaffold15.g4309.t1